jgi:ribosomal protein L44E
MAVKIFCNMCQKFIRDAKAVEISNLRGTEICNDCDKKTAGFIADMEKTSLRAVKQIQDIANRAKADLEEMKKRVIQGEDTNGKDTQKLG